MTLTYNFFVFCACVFKCFTLPLQAHPKRFPSLSHIPYPICNYHFRLRSMPRTRNTFVLPVMGVQPTWRDRRAQENKNDLIT